MVLIQEIDLKTLDEQTFLDVFEGVPQANIIKSDLDNGMDIVDALNEKSGFSDLEYYPLLLL